MISNTVPYSGEIAEGHGTLRPGPGWSTAVANGEISVGDGNGNVYAIGES